MSSIRWRKENYPYGDKPTRCTLCTRMYCTWLRDGPEIVGDFVDWMLLVDDNDERFDDIELERKKQTIQERKKMIYERFITSIYGVVDNDNIIPPDCVQWGVYTMPDDLYWRMEETTFTYDGKRHSIHRRR